MTTLGPVRLPSTGDDNSSESSGEMADLRAQVRTLEAALADQRGAGGSWQPSSSDAFDRSPVSGIPPGLAATVAARYAAYRR